MMISDLFESEARKLALAEVERVARRLQRVHSKSPRDMGIINGEIRRIRNTARACPEERVPLIAEMLKSLESGLA